MSLRGERNRKPRRGRVEVKEGGEGSKVGKDGGIEGLREQNKKQKRG